MLLLNPRHTVVAFKMKQKNEEFKQRRARRGEAASRKGKQILKRLTAPRAFRLKNTKMWSENFALLLNVSSCAQAITKQHISAENKVGRREPTANGGRIKTKRETERTSYPPTGEQPGWILVSGKDGQTGTGIGGQRVFNIHNSIRMCSKMAKAILLTNTKTLSSNPCVSRLFWCPLPTHVGNAASSNGQYKLANSSSQEGKRGCSTAKDVLLDAQS